MSPITCVKFARRPAGPWPEIVHVGTPSYAGTHAEGFHAAIRAIVDTFAEGGPRENTVNLLPGIVSPADLRYLKGILRDFGVEPIVLSDYSDTLDGPTWSEYQRIPQGGTPLADIRRMGRAMATIEFGSTADPAKTAGALLQEAVRRAELRPAPAHRRHADGSFLRCLDDDHRPPLPRPSTTTNAGG